MVGMELGGRVGWGRFYSIVAYQPPTDWTWSGRHAESDVMLLTCGWRPVRWRRRPWALDGGVGIGVERLTVRRLDVPDAATHSLFDLGVVAGAVLGRRLGVGPWSVALTGELRWVPTAHELVVPGGSTHRVNIWSAQLGAAIEWAR